MGKIKKALIGIGLVGSMAVAGLVIPATQQVPTSHEAKLTSCRTWTETYKKPGCDMKKYICVAYIYHRICD